MRKRRKPEEYEITSISTFPDKLEDYRNIKAMIECERPEISVAFDDRKKKVTFVFSKTPKIWEGIR